MTVAATAATADPSARAADWLTRSEAARPMPAEVADIRNEDGASECLAALAGLALTRGISLLILVPDDEPLPAISTALELRLRPLCLVLPAAGFAAQIALRATLSLLRSRLARDDDEAQDAAWQEQRRRITGQPPLWEAAIAWTESNDRGPWPRDVARIFPVRILPVGAYRTLPRQDSDMVVFFRCDLGLETATLPGMHLHIGAGLRARPAGALLPDDDALRLQQEHAQLSSDVAELELELATVQGELGAFTERYVDLVAGRMTELDALRAELAMRRAAGRPDDPLERSAAEHLHAEAARSAGENRRFRQACADAPPSGVFRPAEDVKRLFRQLAQKIHPDRAADEADRAWRTQLMSEANRAYRSADIGALHELAAAWEDGRPPSGTATGYRSATPIPAPGVLVDQVARLRGRLAAIQGELNRLFGSKLYELFLAARQALRHGRDLLQEMAESLDSQICRTRNELETS